jgi:hypothetical protein
MQLHSTSRPAPPLIGQLRGRLFGLSPEEASFARRGFLVGEPRAWRRLEHVGAVFLRGYHAALEENDLRALARRLSEVEAEFRGFAFEGAAMGLALLDKLTPWRRDRWRAFVDGFAAPHVYMAHVGLGWAFARLRLRLAPHLSRLDPLLGWLAVDGYGFHEGYFKWRRYLGEREVPARLEGYALRVFDQGLGRSLWFVKGANVAEILKAVAAFEPARRADLWSGVGLACTYAGGAGRAAIEFLREAAGDCRPQLAQGAAFAAKTRQRAGNLTADTETACRIICRLTAAQAAEVTDLALENLSREAGLPAYEIWRRRIQTYFAREAPPL